MNPLPSLFLLPLPPMVPFSLIDVTDVLSRLTVPLMRISVDGIPLMYINAAFQNAPNLIL
jgi:hypothetical protein